MAATRPTWGPNRNTSTALGFALNYTHQDPVLREIFNDIRFRQALSLAVDREDMSNTLFLGLTEPFTAPVSPSWTGYEDWMGTYFAEFDLDRANALLDEMGLEMGPDGFRLRPDGETLTILGEWPLEWLGYAEDAMDLMALYWAEIGVPAGAPSSSAKRRSMCATMPTSRTLVSGTATVVTR